MKKKAKPKETKDVSETNKQANPEAKGAERQVPKTDANLETGKPASTTDAPIEEGAEINKLLDEGYSVKQIIDLGFKRRTTYHYAKQRTNPENEPAPGTEKAELVSNGKGREIIKLGYKDVIPPEAVMDVIHLPKTGDAVEGWRLGVLDGVGILLLGARYSQLTAAGQAEVVKNQLDILREAKESNMEVAREVAQQTAIEMAKLVVDKIPKPEQAAAPDMAERFIGPVADMAGKQMANLFGKMFGMNPGAITSEGQQQMPSGWEYETKGGTNQ